MLIHALWLFAKSDVFRGVSMKINDLTWRVGGEAGFGILSAGTLIATAAVRSGLHAFANSEYPSLIRGGHNFLHVRINEKPLTSHRKYINILVALNDETVRLHQQFVTPDGCILYDSNAIANTDYFRKDVRLYAVPMLDLVKKVQGNEIARNMVGAGASFAITGFGLDILMDSIKAQFGGKSGKVVEINQKAAEEGYNYIADKYPEPAFGYRLEKRKPNGHILLTAIDSFSIGAVKAGCKFYAAYPMTPATGILNFMAEHDQEYNIVVKQTEDEIAAILLTIGASFAGARAMTGTSGGGFDLMVEGLSLSGMLEVPIVVAEVQRPGPSTGMPTRTEQSDLQMILHAGHGEFERVVIAPGDVDDAFFIGFDAFNVAEHFQLPVLVVMDKYLGDCLATTMPFKTDGLKVNRGKLMSDAGLEKLAAAGERFRRYALDVKDGIVPRAFPGQKHAIHKEASDEHDQFGDVTIDEPADERTQNVDRRFSKFATGVESITGINTGHVNLFSNYDGKVEDADVALVGWGSTKGVLLEVLKMLAADGIKATFLQVVYIHPFPEKKVAEFLGKSQLVIDVEGNKTSQLAQIIREKTGIRIDKTINKYDGRNFDPDDVAETVKEMIGTNGKDDKNYTNGNGRNKSEKTGKKDKEINPVEDIEKI